MTIDYDRLREMVRVVENYTAYDPVEVYTASDELEALAPDLAHELLRLRDGVKQVAETAYIEAEQRLTHLLNGDTE